jgi:hypothetical protein
MASFRDPAPPACSPVRGSDHEMTIDLTMDRFPFLFQGYDLAINKVLMILKLTEANDYKQYQNSGALKLVLKPASGPSIDMVLAAASLLGPVPFKEETLGQPIIVTNRRQVRRSWTLKAESAEIEKIASSLHRKVTVNGGSYYHLDPEKIEDIGLVCYYAVSSS